MEPETWDDVKRVRDEAERILRAPYDVSLKKFRDLLGQVSQDSLGLWSDGNLCQIDRLAALIVDSVEESPYSIEVLQILSHVPSFRSTALKQRPILLYNLLTKAISSGPMFEKYATTCVFLLSPSSSLPELAILPRLLTRLLQKAVQDPTTTNIKLIYHVLSGPKSDLLNMMPADLVIGLQDNLLQILRALEATDHSANLLCLAIFAKLASTEPTYFQALDRPLWSDSVLSPDTSPSNEPISGLLGSCGSAKQFFTSKRACKTLDLVVLKAIMACSCSCSLPSSEIIESLKISEEIVDAVGKDEKRIWMLKNSIKIRKLHEKILRPDINIGVRCAAINFISSLMEGQPLPVELFEVISNLLRASIQIFLTRRTIEKYLIQCDESPVSTIVLEVLELASSELVLDGSSLNRLRKATYLVDSLVTGVQTSARLRQKILYSLSTDAFAEKIQQFLRLPLPNMPPGSSHDSSAICPLLALRAKSDLCKSVCVLLIKTAMFTSQDKISLDSSVATSLLDKHTELLERTSIQCDSYRDRSVHCSTEQVPVLAQGSLLTANLSSMDWRESLLKYLSTAAQHQHSYLVKIVSEICRDLETRCDNVERPLREAKDMSDDLRLKLDSSEATIAKMESKARKTLSILNSLEAENHRLVEQVDAAEKLLQFLSTAHEELSHRLECVNRDALKSIESAREKEEQEKLAHLAIVTGKDEIFEMQALKLAEAEARAISLRDELDQKNAVSEEILSRLEDSMNTTNKELEASKQLADSRKMEITRLHELEAKMTVDKQVLESKLKQSEAQGEFLSAELNANVAVYANERASLQFEHDASLAAANVERESQALTIQRLRNELNKVVEDANAAAKSSESSLAQANKKIMNLRREREAKAKEFAEVKDLSSRLIEVMGIDHTRTATQTTNQNAISRKNSNNNQIEDHIRHVKSVADPGNPLVSSAVSRSAPSTKRTKTLRSPKSSLAQLPEPSTPSWECNGGIFNKETRSALKEMGINHSSSKKIAAKPFPPFLHTCGELQKFDNNESGKENKDNNLDGVECNHSFGESDIFDSTDPRQHSESNERSTIEQFDDTTVDF